MGALRLTGMIAPMVLDEPMNGFCFLSYVEHILVPKLGPGAAVNLDNLWRARDNEYEALVYSVSKERDDMAAWEFLKKGRSTASLGENHHHQWG